MTTLTVTTSSASYPVLVDDGALAALPAHLTTLGLRGRLWLISDDAVLPLHGPALVEPLRAAGYELATFAVPSGEASKSLSSLTLLYDWLIGGAVERRDAVLALGGGVVGDLAGFAAASVLRGIAVVQLPTTLLAMVDAAVGGKTGVNHPLGKNLIGAFHPPRLVLADTATLSTLPPRELRAGWAEVIKHGVISDAGLFVELEDLAATRRATSADPLAWRPGDPRLTAIIRRAVAVKVGVVSRDEREQGERITLNYGHTIAHAVEALSGYGELLHGEAVAIGMHAAARIAAAMGLCDAGLVERQRALLGAYGLATALPPGLDPAALIAATLRDKKVQARKVRWVLPTAIGAVVVRDDVPEALVHAALAP
jgi:3-dehydroquinate synthase